jgi:hypothetical protein
VCQGTFSPYTSPLNTHFVISNLIRKFNGRSLDAKLKKKYHPSYIQLVQQPCLLFNYLWWTWLIIPLSRSLKEHGLHLHYRFISSVAWRVRESNSYRSLHSRHYSAVTNYVTNSSHSSPPRTYPSHPTIPHPTPQKQTVHINNYLFLFHISFDVVRKIKMTFFLSIWKY